MSRPKLVLCWSGGKDSALALHRLQQEGRYAVAGLLTTVTRGWERISMHGVRDALLTAQADALGLPLHRVWIPPACVNDEYQAAMGLAIEELKAAGVTAMGFGDLFLEEIRRYREAQLAPTGLAPVFPLWGQDTALLARSLIAEGFRARLCCVDPRKVPAQWAGREFDAGLLRELPPGVDPCGENGEFHTFVHAAPNFRAPIPHTVGERVERDGFSFVDLVPAAQSAA
jgi:uncharacterized protein (TIGR00290 family)